MILSIVRLLAAVILAFLAGKLISKLKLPSILGWLIAGMVLGPHALSLVTAPSSMRFGIKARCIFWNVRSA